MALLYLGQDGVCIAEAGALSLVDGQGRLRWKKATTRIRPQPHTALMAPEGLVVYSNSEIVCLDPKSGQMRWGRGVRASDQRSLSRQGGALYAIAPPVVSRLDWATGRDVWAADLPPLLQGYDGAEVHAAPGGVFFLTHDGWLGRLDGASGEMVCPWPHAGTTYSGLVATAAYAAASAPDGTAVTAWDPRTGAELWTSRPSGEESIAWSLVGGGGRALYVGSHPGVAALSAKDGQVLWRVKPQGPPAPPPDAYHGWYPTATAVEGDGVTFTLMGMDVVAVGERGKPMVRVNTPGPIFAHWLVGRRFYFVATASIGATTEEPSMYVIGPQGQAR